MVVFMVENRCATGRDAAQAFAETFKPPRIVCWHFDNKFHFQGGLKIYAIRNVPRGWEIIDDIENMATG